MSGSSRIGGFGRYGGHGAPEREGRSASFARFRHGRKAGDVVRGEFLRHESATLGWALLEGEELLVRLPSDGPAPREGETVFFRVEALAPEVVLRKLPSSDPLARLALALPPVPLSREGALYIAARDKLDGLLASSGVLAGQCGEGARKVFIDAVARHPGMAEAFAEGRARSRALVRAASSAGLVFFRHMPWLCADVAALEVSLWEKGESPVFAGATLFSGERILLRGFMESGVFRYRMNAVPVSERAATGGRRGRDSVSGENVTDIVGRILALAARADGAAVRRFSRTL